jgi:hypothetical protein
MIQLTRAVKAWGEPDFNAVLKQDIEQINVDHLPLEQGLCSGNYVSGNQFSAMIISAADADGFIRAKAGIFYKGILGGCSCADDPTPVEEQSEYCELLFDIDKKTAEAAVTLVQA